MSGAQPVTPNRSTQAVRAYAATLGFTVVTILLGLWSNRVLYPLLGDERFGAAKALTDWQSNLVILEFGLSGALAPMFARALARDDPRQLAMVVGLGVRAYVGVVILCGLAGIVLLPLMDHLVPVGPDLVHERFWAWLFLLAALPSLCASPCRTLLDARQLGWRVSLYLTLQAVVIVGLMVAFAARGYGVAGQTAATALGMLGFAAAVSIDAAWLLRREIRARPEPVCRPADDPPVTRRELGRALRSLSLPTALLTIAGRLSLTTDILVVSAVLGSGAVPLFFFTTRLPLLAQAQLQAVASASWAGLAQLEHQGRRDVFVARLLELTRLTTILAVAALVPIACWGREFVALWMTDPQGQLYAGTLAASLSCANAWGVGLWSLWGWCFAGTGRPTPTLGPALLGAALNIALSLFLAQRLGVVGPLWGTFLGLFLVQLPWMARLLTQTFHVPLRPLVAALFQPLLLVVPLATLGQALRTLNPQPGWIALSLMMAATAVAALLLAWTLAIPNAERHAWRQRLRHILPRPHR